MQFFPTGFGGNITCPIRTCWAARCNSITGTSRSWASRRRDSLGVTADVYLPLKLMRDPGRTSIVNLLLRPGVSRATADAALQPLVEQFAKYMPNDFPDVFKVHVEG